MHETENPEEMLLAQLRENMDEGAALLMDRYSGMVWAVCARRLKDPEDIKECVNSTFADFCMYHGRYDSAKGSLRNYLCTIADRRALERYRKLSAARRAEEKYRILNAHLQQLSGQEHLTEHLHELLEHLSHPDAQLLRMRFFRGLTYREIATELGLPYETIRKRGQRCLNRLKASLK